MTPDPADPPSPELAALHPVEGAAPADRTLHLVAMIEADAGGKLQLPVTVGRRFMLQGLQFGADNLRSHIAQQPTPPAWWHGEGASLRDARFRDADLERADLSGADCTRADFTGVAMRSATLRGARLERAQFTGADLSGSDFTNVQASEAHFANALLEDTRFTGATLRFADFTGALLDGANLEGADLWSARMEGADLTDAVLRHAVLQEARLAGADLTGANLAGAELKKADLRGAKLYGADLRGASLARADLEGADLGEASLPRVDLTTCNLRRARLAGAWLENTRFNVEQLGDGLGEEIAGEHHAARQGYLSLEQNFRSLGRPDAASWAYRRARRMGKLEALGAFRAGVKARRWVGTPRLFMTWFGDAFAEWLCEYGESLSRVVRAYLAALVGFAAYYGLSGSLLHTAAAAPELVGQPTRNVIELLGFSFLNMCTPGVSDLGLKPASQAVYFVSSLQYVVGVVLLGLFGYVLGNRIRR